MTSPTLMQKIFFIKNEVYKKKGEMSFIKRCNINHAKKTIEL